MKGQESSCEVCNTKYIKKNKIHLYCSKKCRNKAYRDRNGIEKPDFMKKYESKKAAIQAAPQQQVIQQQPVQQQPVQQQPVQQQVVHQLQTTPLLNNQYNILAPDNHLLQLQTQKSYYENKLREIDSGKIPVSFLFGVGGVVIGKSTAEKLAYGLIGALIGGGIDQNAEQAKRQAEGHVVQQIARLNREIREHKKWSRVLQHMSKQKAIQPNDHNSLKVTDKNTLVSALDYKKEHIKGLDFSDHWQYLVGNPAQNFYMIVHGLPGNGKSTFGVRFAEYFGQSHGRTLYINREQSGQSLAFQNLLKQNGAKSFDIDRDNGKVDAQYLTSISAPYDLVVLDSINYMKLKPDEIDQFRKTNPTKAVLGIMQSTKDGNMRGSQEFIHDADIVLQMDNFTANQTKSRFAAPAKFLFEI